jgi:hypothetical protein
MSSRRSSDKTAADQVRAHGFFCRYQLPKGLETSSETFVQEFNAKVTEATSFKTRSASQETELKSSYQHLLLLLRTRELI